MLKQDLLIGIVSVSAIVYVILFDGSPAGPVPGQSAGAVPGTAWSQPATGRSTDGLLVIGSEGSVTPQARAKLIEDVRLWVERPIPGDFDRLKADHEAILSVADSISLYHVELDEPLRRAFAAKVAELHRYFLLQRTTIALAEVANNFLIPGSTEHEKIDQELARLRELQSDVETVERRYEFVYPKDRKAYLTQLIDVLAGMKKI